MAEKKDIIDTMIFFSEVNYSSSQAWIKQLQMFRKQLLPITPSARLPTLPACSTGAAALNSSADQ